MEASPARNDVDSHSSSSEGMIDNLLCTPEKKQFEEPIPVKTIEIHYNVNDTRLTKEVFMAIRKAKN